MEDLGKFWRNDSRKLKTKRYKKDASEEMLLYGINRSLQNLELATIKEIADSSSTPILCISYVPRSGSSLLYQLLASTKTFNYISNFQSRFWLAPYLGGVLEKSLFDKFSLPVSFRSDYGVTSAPSEPAEFTYFWEYWLNLAESERHTLAPKDYRKIKINQLARELNALRAMSRYPLLFKKEWLGMNAGFLLKYIPNIRFVHIERNSYDIAVSILKARKDVYGNRNTWWAAKPSNYCQVAQLDAYHQVAGQIHGIRNDIQKWMKMYPGNFLTVQYESLRTDVHSHLKIIADFAGVEIPKKNLEEIPKKFSPPPRAKITASGSDKILKALHTHQLNG